jgi:predicted N-acetyltransferase YhbS
MVDHINTELLVIDHVGLIKARNKSTNERLAYMTEIRLRKETPADYREVENVTREAFWNHHSPGCDEHYLLHIIRESDAFIRDLDFIAEIDGKIVGNIIYTESKIVGDNGECCNTITFGPISVMPEYQGIGIGRMLIKHTIELARNCGYKAILIYGDPNYYSRFGFVAAETYDIRTPDDMYAAPLQVLALYPGALSGCSGRFFEDTDYEIDAAAAVEFDKTFPHKDRLSGLPTQRRFEELVKSRKPRF